MPKRKRDGSVASSSNGSAHEDDQQEPAAKPYVRRSKSVQDKLHHGTTVLQRALKLARGFERQKFSRRVKAAAAENDEAKLARIEEEKGALQSLDLQLAARKCLRRHIDKEKSLREAIAVELEFGDINHAKQQGDATAVANVESRLYGSNPVKEALPAVLNSIRDVLGLSNSKNAKGQRTKTPRVSKSVNRDGSVSSVESQDDSEGSEEDDASRNQIPTRSKPRKVVKPPPERPAEATFLPSLTMGGYLSGSESGDDDPYDDPQRAIPERKNRRGQRARQAIWEKKYGQKAKHLQQEGKSHKGARESRDAGWDMKRGAQESGATRRRPGEKPWLANRNKKDAASASGGNAVELKPRKFESRQAHDAKPLHPSWEAARKAKEAKATPSFSGTKVVFD